MSDRDAELLAKLLPTFRLEAEEHLRRLDVLLASLRGEPSPAVLDEAFREVHSLKGAARAVGAADLESLCQEMETVFARVKKGEIPLERTLLELLFLAADLAAKMAQSAGGEIPPAVATLHQEATGRLRQAAQGRPPGPPSPPSPPPPGDAALPPPPAFDTLRIKAERMEEVLVQTEELLADKLGAARRVEALRELLAGIERLRRDLGLATERDRSLQSPGVGTDDRREVGRIDMTDRLVTAEELAAALAGDGRQCLREAEELSRSLATKIDTLLATVRGTLMLPVANLLEHLPRLVRELARASGKAADLETTGGEIMVDRRILEALRDPLLHLLRNATDHGIEGPEERQRQGKPARGRIRLEVASPAPRRVLFTLTDDGRGLDLAQLREAAVRDGLLAPEEAAALSDEEAAALAFSSGVSTREHITSISGRGLGLPIVRERIERLGGTVQVTTRPGEGTTFRLEIPAALASFRGVLTRAGGSSFVFPALEVERVVRVRQDELGMVSNRQVLELAGSSLPVVPLTQVLHLPGRPSPEGEVLPVVLLTGRGAGVGFVVDEVLAEQELQVKGLGRQLIKVKNFSGATILEDGGVALILDPDDLVASAAAAAAAIPAPAAAIAEPIRRRVLVVEDSITARTLLRNILEGAGFAVTTAVDGIDALQRLSSAVFDIVVSDVQMPRMDGFRLTQRIRENYGRLPVILVTGLESEEDRERGIVAGADAYIVKSRFDQGNLLEAIARLV